MNTTEEIAAIREALTYFLNEEADFRRIGKTTAAHEMALIAVTCREKITRLELRENGE